MCRMCPKVSKWYSLCQSMPLLDTINHLWLAIDTYLMSIIAIIKYLELSLQSWEHFSCVCQTLLKLMVFSSLVVSETRLLCYEWSRLFYRSDRCIGSSLLAIVSFFVWSVDRNQLYLLRHCHRLLLEVWQRVWHLTVWRSKSWWTQWSIDRRR